jgi:hypothetical protein
MPDLKIDLDALAALHRDLSRTVSVFESASMIGGNLADEVGHDGHARELSDKVAAFASGWQYRRQHICDSMHTIERAVQVIHDTFVTADQDLSNALTGQG